MTGCNCYGMHNPIVKPSLAEIEKMDQLHQQAIDSLEISADGLVKCQKCGVAVHMAAKGLRLARSNGDRITPVF